MTISILAYDAETGTYGGAATTGSLCVGGWVLRGGAESGLSASQGSLPSTLWGTQVLDLMRTGLSAAIAVSEVVDSDAGRAHRQLAAVDRAGGTGHFTGASSIPAAGARQGPSVVVTGNLLSGDDVLDACLDGYQKAQGSMAERLIAALNAAAAAGGDSRGLLSAALLVVSRSAAPLNLRIDYSEQPLQDLADLHQRATSGAYGQWSRLVPTLDEPHRAEPYSETVTPAG
ncbi:fimbrial assembly protein FimA [Brevirhabdus pacifica]|uniref:Fimbrial assembly protein FimA n=1 Tax=Brevirhabdus pacifica TaxID=1267768 RepID=A0A1U7DEZ6_9RHOB|nr:DUF1028 domain-containing protein [Brevirhabdus pacifica]APX88531.1 fimbrial assembly protein FimA [Brevirhabdus pacifica]OWU79830.1 major pilin protein fimA [Loktanella sp. 22II-4b]PJJ86987.1 putative Ntn-hydrolase superfamily protein [Brevirhabdus pacifica]